jgi:hypothetical protein
MESFLGFTLEVTTLSVAKTSQVDTRRTGTTKSSKARQCNPPCKQEVDCSGPPSATSRHWETWRRGKATSVTTTGMVPLPGYAGTWYRNSPWIPQWWLEYADWSWYTEFHGSPRQSGCLPAGRNTLLSIWLSGPLFSCNPGAFTGSPPVPHHCGCLRFG